VEQERDGGVLTCTAAGELDVESAHTLRECVTEALDERPDELILDLCGVTFIDSSGLATIIDTQRRAQQQGVDFGVRCGDGKVRQVLELTQLDRRLRMLG
jgi:anti-anti-sigma factor